MERLTDVLGHFASGVAVVAARDPGDGRAAALAVRSFASLSLDPPLVLLCVDRTSAAWPVAERAGRFGVSILAEEHRTLADRADGAHGSGMAPGSDASGGADMADRADGAHGSRGSDPADGTDWAGLLADGAVHVEGALAVLDCAVHTVHEAGDHLVVTARVLALDARPDGRPLLSYRSDYTTGVFP
ncbi:flavin reductase family protein [Streptomyces sp. NPDC053493]|uniref:flavin reductase family protein n=1 Tax=Streptomyces sp. NPDC053493 TaxID=3365705 RepID=UPI0037D581C4